jgi:hypothetical protein
VIDMLCHRLGIALTKRSIIRNRDGEALACRKLHPITENEQWTATDTPMLHMCTIPSIACVLRLRIPVTSVTLPMQLDLVSRRHILPTAFYTPHCANLVAVCEHAVAEFAQP